MNRVGIGYITVSFRSGSGRTCPCPVWTGKKRALLKSEETPELYSCLRFSFFSWIILSVPPYLDDFFGFLFAGNFCLSASVTSCTYLLLCGVREYFVIHEELNQSSLSHVILHCISFLFQMKWMGVTPYGV